MTDTEKIKYAKKKVDIKFQESNKDKETKKEQIEKSNQNNVNKEISLNENKEFNSHSPRNKEKEGSEVTVLNNNTSSFIFQNSVQTGITCLTDEELTINQEKMFCEDDWFNFFLNNPNTESLPCDYNFAFNELTGYDRDKEDFIIGKACVICYKENCKLDESHTNLPCKCYSSTLPFHETFNFYAEYRNLNHTFSHLNYNILRLHDQIYFVNQSVLATRIKYLKALNIDTTKFDSMLKLICENNMLNSNSYNSYFSDFPSNRGKDRSFSGRPEFNYNNSTNINVNNDKLVKYNICDHIIDSFILSGNFDDLLSFINNKENTNKLLVMYKFFSTFEKTYYLPEMSLNQKRTFLKKSNEFFAFLTASGYTAIKNPENLGYFFYYMYFRLIKPSLRYSLKFFNFSTLLNLSCTERYMIFKSDFTNADTNIYDINQENFEFLEKFEDQDEKYLEKIIKNTENKINSNTPYESKLSKIKSLSSADLINDAVDTYDDLKDYLKNLEKFYKILKDENIKLGLKLLDYHLEFLMNLEEESYSCTSILLELVKNYTKFNYINPVLIDKIIKEILVFAQVEGFLDTQRCLIVLKICFFYFLHTNDRVLYSRYQNLKSNKKERFDYSSTWVFDSKNQVNHQFTKLFLVIMTIVKQDINKVVLPNSSFRIVILSICDLIFMRNPNKENFYINCIKNSYITTDIIQMKNPLVAIPLDVEIGAFKVIIDMYDEYLLSYKDFIIMLDSIVDSIVKKAAKYIIKSHNNNSNLSKRRNVLFKNGQNKLDEETDIFNEDYNFYDLELKCNEYISCLFYNLYDSLLMICYQQKAFLKNKQSILDLKEVEKRKFNNTIEETNESEYNETDKIPNNNKNCNNNRNNESNSKQEAVLSKKTTTNLLRLLCYLSTKPENFMITLNVSSIRFTEVFLSSNPLEFLSFFKKFNKLYFKLTESRILNDHSFITNIFHYLNNEYYSKLIEEKDYDMLLKFITPILSLVNNLVPLCSIKDERLIQFFKKVLAWIAEIKHINDLYSLILRFLECSQVYTSYFNSCIAKARKTSYKRNKDIEVTKINNNDNLIDQCQEEDLFRDKVIEEPPKGSIPKPKTLNKFLSWLFKLYTSLLLNDWFFLKITNANEHILFDLNFITHINIKNHDPKLEFYIRKFAILLSLAPYSNTDCAENSMKRLYTHKQAKTGIYIIKQKNFSIRNLALEVWHQELHDIKRDLSTLPEYKELITINPENSSILDEITPMSLFELRIEHYKQAVRNFREFVLNSSKILDDGSDRIKVIYMYLTDIILIPGQSLMNMTFAFIDKLKGSDLKLIHEMMQLITDACEAFFLDLHESSNYLNGDFSQEEEQEAFMSKLLKYRFTESNYLAINLNARLSLIRDVKKKIKETMHLYHNDLIEQFNILYNEVLQVNKNFKNKKTKKAEKNTQSKYNAIIKSPSKGTKNLSVDINNNLETEKDNTTNIVKDVENDDNKQDFDDTAGNRLVHNYLNDLEIAAQNNQISIINHLIDNYNNDREYIISIFKFIFTSIDPEFSKNSNIDSGKSSGKHIKKNSRVNNASHNRAFNVHINNLNSEVGISAYAVTEERVGGKFLLKISGAPQKLSEIEIKKRENELIQILRNKSREFPFDCFVVNSNSIEPKLTFSNISNICILNSLIVHNPELIVEFMNDLMEEDNSYFEKFFSHIFSHLLYPSLLQGIYKQFNPLFISANESLSKEIFDLLTRLVTRICSGKDNNLLKCLYNIDFTDIVGSLNFYISPSMEGLFKKRFSLLNFLCYFILITMENIESIYRMNNYNSPPDYLMNKVLEQTNFYISSTMKLIIKFLSNPETSNQKEFFEASIPSMLKTNQNNLKNELILNFFPFLNVLDYFEETLFNTDVEGLIDMKLSIIQSLIDLIENVRQDFIDDKLIFYLKTHNIYISAEKALVNCINQIKRAEDSDDNVNNINLNIKRTVSLCINGITNMTESSDEFYDEFNANHINRIDYSDLVDIMYSPPEKLSQYYDNKYFQLYLNLMLLASYTTNYYDLPNSVNIKLANSFIFDDAKRKLLNDREQMIEIIKSEKINFGFSDNEENLSCFYSLVLYSAFEKRVEYYYKDELCLKLFYLTEKGFILAYHWDKLRSLEELKIAQKKKKAKEINKPVKKVEIKELLTEEVLDKEEDKEKDIEEKLVLVDKSDPSYVPPNIALTYQNKGELNNNPNSNANTNVNKVRSKTKRNTTGFSAYKKTSNLDTQTTQLKLKPKLSSIEEGCRNQYKSVRLSFKLNISSLFNMALFEKEANMLCHPDRLDKFSSELWNFFKNIDQELSENLRQTHLLKILQNDLILGQIIAYILGIMIVFYAFFFVDDIINLTYNQACFFNSIAILQLLALITNLVIFLYSKLKMTKRIAKEDLELEELVFGIKTSKYNLNVISECFGIMLFLLLVVCGMVFESRIIFYVFQVFFVYLFSPTIRSIYQAFLSRTVQLLCLMFVLFNTITCFATLGFFWYNPEFSIGSMSTAEILSYSNNSNNHVSFSGQVSLTRPSHTHVQSGDDQTFNVCESLLSCVYFYFNFGLRSGGGIGDNLRIKSMEESYYWIRFVMDILFYIVLILLFLNMMNGIIINGFAKYREKEERTSDTKENKCFICNMHKTTFDKKKINFERHVKYEHNPHNYFLYINHLKNKGLHNMSTKEKHFCSCLRKGIITVFPVENGFKIALRNRSSTQKD